MGHFFCNLKVTFPPLEIRIIYAFLLFLILASLCRHIIVAVITSWYCNSGLIIAVLPSWNAIFVIHRGRSQESCHCYSGSSCLQPFLPPGLNFNDSYLQCHALSPLHTHTTRLLAFSISQWPVLILFFFPTLRQNHVAVICIIVGTESSKTQVERYLYYQRTNTPLTQWPGSWWLFFSYAWRNSLVCIL